MEDTEVLEQYGPAAAVRIFTLGEEYQPPAQLLADLTPHQAVQVPAGAPYSIAEVLAHTVFWQEIWLARIEGVAPPPPAREGPNSDWPPASPEDWPLFVERFLSGLEHAWTLAEQREDLHRQLEDDGKTVGQLILHLVQHNNYHMGQIALLRQLQGLWPTAGGEDDTWKEPLNHA